MNRPSRAMSPSAPHWSQPPSIPQPSSSRRLGGLVDESQTISSPATGIPDKQLKAYKRQAFDIAFDHNFARLKEFKQEFGDTDVPFHSKGVYRVGDKTIDWKKYSGLGKWCSKMRTQIRVYQAKKVASQLSLSQDTQLFQLGFCMDPIRYLSTKPIWNEKYYQQLQAFYQEHGHSKVPNSSSKVLSRWVSRLQEADQRKQQGEPTTLTDQHIAQLNQLELQWNPPKKSSFEENARKWLGYKAEHGQAPPSSHPLGKWVSNTRLKYLDFQTGRPTPLTQTHVDQLTEWGFPWKSNQKRQKVSERKTFDERLHHLKEYKATFGDTLVPQAYPGLGTWVNSMRTSFKLLLEGKQSAMTEERLEKLRQVGFSFETQFNKSGKAASRQKAPEE
jgi:hypothetical protein